MPGLKMTVGSALLALACSLVLVGASSHGAQPRDAGALPRIAVVTDTSASARELQPLAAALAAVGQLLPATVLTSGGADTGGGLARLREADTAVIFRGPGVAMAVAEREAFHALVAAGAGLVIITARQESWPAEFRLADMIGGMPGGTFAGGAPLAVINLFPHPIFAGISRLETSRPVLHYEKLAEDAQMIMEGTVGEVTTPLGWVRRRASGRICHLALGGPELFADAAYQRLVANALLWVAARPVPGAQPAVQRTFMPEAYPGAFAITLPEGPGICLDPVRGGINYIWDGDFVDLRPRWLTKQGEPARIFGDVFYREKEWQPLRAGSPSSAPDFEFRGYTLQEGYPEFHYTVGGREVHERLTSLPGGGVLRRFRVGPGAAPLWLQLEPQPAAEIALRGLERDGSIATYSAKAAGEFTIEIRRKAVVAP